MTLTINTLRAGKRPFPGCMQMRHAGKLKAYEKTQNGDKDMTCGLFYQFLSGMEYMDRHQRKLKFQASVFLISGAQNPVVDFGKGVENCTGSIENGNNSGTEADPGMISCMTAAAGKYGSIYGNGWRKKYKNKC